MKSKIHEHPKIDIMNVSKKICLVISIPFVLAACQNNASKEAEVAAMKQHTIDSMKQAEAKHRHKEARENQFDAAQTTEATPATTTAPATTETQKKKKGWSNTAKGAVIGAGAGAVAGAVIDHNNRGAGAVIGGLAGAAVGAGTGAVIDHKKKQQQSNQ